MKTLIYSAMLLLFMAIGVKAQSNDEFQVTGDLQLNVLFMRLNGPYEITHSGGADGFVAEPVYRNIDTLSIGGGGALHIGVSVPIIRKSNWSIGIKAAPGIGYGVGLRAAESLNSLYFDLPAYLYYRLEGANLAVSFLAGYKYVYGPIPYHANLIGIEFHLDEGHSIRIQSMVLPYRYWGLKTTGEYFPILRMRDIGISYVLGSGRR